MIEADNFFGHASKYNKIAGNGENFSLIEATNDLAMFQNTTRLQAMRGTFKLLTPPDILHCLRLQQDCRQRRQISIIEATNELAMSEIQQDCRQEGKFKWLKPPMIWRCAKIQQDSRQATNNYAMCENTTRLQATGENWSYWSHHVKIQQVSRQATNNCAMFENTTRWLNRGKVNYWSHQLSGHVWEYSKIPGKPPIIVQCVKIQQDCRQQGEI